MIKYKRESHYKLLEVKVTSEPNSGITLMEVKKILAPRTTINSEGKIAYSESFQAWNTIHLKKDLFSEFPALREKRSKFAYKLVFCRDLKEFEEILKESKKGNSLPLLLWLYKESD